MSEVKSSQIRSVLYRKSTGETYSLLQNIFTVGSGKINNLVVDGEKIRKLHLQILLQDGRHLALAMNGDMEINSELLSEKVLQEGDLIKLGDEVLEFRKELEPNHSEEESDQGSFLGVYQALYDTVLPLLAEESIEKSYHEILVTGVRLMQADGGYLFSESENGLELLHAIPEDNPVYSESALKAAKSRRDTVIWSATETDENEISEHSIEQKNIYSILVAPLVESDNSHPMGYLYLHRRQKLKPFNEEERKIFQLVSRALGAVLLANRKRSEQEKQLESLRENHGTGDMIAESTPMKKIVDLANKISASQVPILITGETGTGKEVMAKYIHNQSDRTDKAFVPVNCGAIPEHLIETELFGHEKGSFTGATGMKKGFFEQADGGTLFLDEIGELPILMQVKFLRVLQDGMVRRVGGTGEFSVNVRIITATNKDLSSEVAQGHFRQDLLYRLNLMHLHLPPLREREGDILLLSTAILKKASSKFNMNTGVLSKAAEKVLLKYAWPGNVRELENKLQKALLNSSSRVIDVEDLDLPEDFRQPAMSLKAVRERAERAALQHALTKAKGNLTLAASFLDIDRKVLRDIMQRLGLKKEEFKNSGH